MRWGRAEHPLPRPKPSDPTSKERGGEVGQKRDTGDDATRRGARVVPRREWKGGREGGIEPPFPPDPYSAHCPPPLAWPLNPYHRKGHWARPPAQGAPPSRRLSLPTFPSGATRLEERLTSQAGGVWGFGVRGNTNPNPKLTLSLMLTQTRVWGCGVLGWRVR